jgi:undecaprenyl-diphosphatase
VNPSNALFLGLVQGLTEFLPVSSSGHLVLAQTLLDFVQPGISFDIWLHLATLVAVLAALRREVMMMLRSLVPGAPAAAAVPGRRLVIGLIVGTIPAAVVGLVAKDAVEATFTSVRLVGVDLLLTAVILATTRLRRAGNAPLTTLRSFLIGAAQAVAILPGVSRSGSTLAASHALGLSGEDAARFSFLLSVPAILGAVVLDSKSLAALGSMAPLALALGFVTAAAAGYLAIRVVWRIMVRGKLAWFAPYCALLGVAAILWGGGR